MSGQGLGSSFGTGVGVRFQDEVGIRIGFLDGVSGGVDVRFRDGGQGRDRVWGRVFKRGLGLVFGFRGRGRGWG